MNKVINYIFGILIVIIGIATLYFFLFPKKESKSELKKEDSYNIIQNDLRLGIAELDTMNPILSKNRNVYEYSKLMYSSIITLDEYYRVKNDLAEEIIKQDELTYKIILRNMYWGESEEIITSSDVKFTLEQITKNNSLYKKNVENISEITINSDKEFILKLKEPDSFFEYNLTFPVMKMVDENIFKDKEKYLIPETSRKIYF